MLVVLFVDPGVHVVAAMPATQTGVASGMNANIRTLGGAVGSALTASIVTATVLSSGLPTELGYRNSFWLMAVACAAAAVAGELDNTAQLVDRRRTQR